MREGKEKGGEEMEISFFIVVYKREREREREVS